MAGKEIIETDVLVVGAGPIGLCVAVALGQWQNRVLLAERDGARGPQPRAKTHNMRSMLHYRRWGLADKIRAASPTMGDVTMDIVFQTRLFGKHIATIPNIYFRGGAHASDPRFCEASEWIPQYTVEDVIRGAVEELPTVDLRNGVEVSSFVQDKEGVTAELVLQNGERQTVRAKYIVGADGGGSMVRRGIGGELKGKYAYDCNFNMVLRIPELTANPPKPLGMMHWLINEEAPGIMGPMGDLWYISKKLSRGISTMTNQEIRAFLKSIVGREVDFEVLTLDPWYAHELISDTYGQGRAFIVGDACQLRPPFGGFGMNMGVGDAANLAWKLDALLNGWGGEKLLESYEYERRKTHQWAVKEAVINYSVLSQDLVRPDLEEDTPEGEAARKNLAKEIIEKKRDEFHTIGLVLGYDYQGSSVIAESETGEKSRVDEYEPLAVPGALAPHFWLAPGRSIYDELGRGLTLFYRDAAVEAVGAIKQAAIELGVPLKSVALPEAAGSLYPSRLTIVRPDEHVAWTGDVCDLAAALSAIVMTVGMDRALALNA